jgi:tetratricopeptide (TPR) repeat protein
MYMQGRYFFFVFGLLCWFALVVQAQEQASEQEEIPTPEVCQQALQEHDMLQRKKDWHQCLDQADNDIVRGFAHINLGTMAYFENDFSKAASHYDAAILPGKSISSDIFFHAWRAATYDRVGRPADGLEDAKKVYWALKGNEIEGNVAQKAVMEAVLPLLFEEGETEMLDGLLHFYAATEDAGIIDLSNKVAIFSQVGRPDAAMPFLVKLVEMEPENPVVLNNYCYTMAENGKSEQALPYCEKANRLQPDTAFILHSLAFVLAKTGQCDRSETFRKRAQALRPDDIDYQERVPCQPKQE